MRRRSLVLGAPALGLGGRLAAQPAPALTPPAPPPPAVVPRALVFPADHGAHPDFRTEWWYITGHALAGDRAFGFQVTFFRSRVAGTQALRSQFAARQLLFAHAAVTDVRGRKLWHDQRIARQGFGIAEASTADTRVRLRDWSLLREGDAYRALLPASDFTLDLRFTPTQPLLLQGQAGVSRKGADPSQASYYYSHPQLAARGRILLQGQGHGITGTAWLDHEWSQSYLAAEAAGWDWIGMNLDDGGALMAFRMRRPDGSRIWDGGSFRSPQGVLTTFRPGEVEFTPQRRWTSPDSGASYPVEWSVRTPVAAFTVRALFDNQELDSRASTGAIYWEGLSDLLDAAGRRVGRGYLEMTGYAQPLRL